MKAMIKVLIVDDEPPARDLLASMLSCHDSIQIIGMVGNVPEARAFLQQETPDVVFRYRNARRAGSGFTA